MAFLINFFILDGFWVIDQNTDLSLIFDLWVLSIDEFLLHADESCKLWQYLMANRFFHDFCLLVYHFHVEHALLQLSVVGVGLLQQTDLLELAHLVDKGQAFWFRRHQDICEIGSFGDWIFVEEGNGGGLLKMSLEIDVKIHQVTFQNVGQRLWIGDHTCHNVFIVF